MIRLKQIIEITRGGWSFFFFLGTKGDLKMRKRSPYARYYKYIN